METMYIFPLAWHGGEVTHAPPPSINVVPLWVVSFASNTNLSTEAHIPTPQYGQYLTHADKHIFPVVAAMDSCFVLIGLMRMA